MLQSSYVNYCVLLLHILGGAEDVNVCMCSSCGHVHVRVVVVVEVVVGILPHYIYTLVGLSSGCRIGHWIPAALPLVELATLAGLMMLDRNGC